MTDTTWHIPDPVTQPEFYADVPTKRLLAWGVDTVVIFLACVIVVALTALTGLFFFPLLMLTIGFAYRVITISRHSATWGMRLMAIEFRNARGGLFDLPMAFAHTLGFTLSCVLAVVQLVSIVLMLTTARGQGLTDLVLGTVVINRRARS